MVSIVSMAVVAFAAASGSTPAYEVFYKRLVAFLIGGSVAMVVEVVVTPVRARDCLVKALSDSLDHIQKMQRAMYVGIDGPERPDLQSQALLNRFTHARDGAQDGLNAAETFLPDCLNEPRLKGSFKPLAPIYQEIVYVLQQIVDRMDGVVQLRGAYGSTVLEGLHSQVFAYRRNVAASSALILFSISGALVTRLPLPQFIPSARIAQLRLINHVRGLVMAEHKGKQRANAAREQQADSLYALDEETADMITERKFLSWNATTAGQMEIIEYLEELVELVKLLVGVNAFRSGMLERPRYGEYARRVDDAQDSWGAQGRAGDEESRRSRSQVIGGGKQSSAGGDATSEPLRTRATMGPEISRRRTWADTGAAVDAESEDEDQGIPRSLQRVGTRLREDSTVVRRRATYTSHGAGAA
ncbi:hypothetical protein CDD82_7919 [Ophiocordyceps australis]|uniref:DUF2421 domain-containing protein n=1 Tax=Ophiocordyceps australis TaxID=1399860 RepID=A0A2C5YNX1_9HYPO|nr:hypothetical protein CDD82_7919 [Ophiocordyceps australis]